jgi:hypothetical protein
MHRITGVMVLLALSASAAAQAPSSVSPATDGNESLGTDLLDDLMPDIPAKPVSPLAEPERNSNSQKPPRGPAPRFDDLGEDIDSNSGPLSLVRVRQGMQRAESLLGEPLASNNEGALNEAAQVQNEVVDQLDQLIAELSKQCKGGQRPPGNQPPNPSAKSQAKPGNSQNAAAQGQTAARDSMTRLNNAAAKPVDKAEIEQLAKELWGHLPERTREQMMQSLSEEFLPKYEREIADYYRSLSEEQNSPSAQE